MNRYGPLIFVLAAVWGASYLFIKVAVDDVEPSVLMAVRGFGAGIVLLGYLAWREGGRNAVAQLRAAWFPCLVLGVINAALPFWLVAWGETHIDSSVAGIAQATVPMFNVLLVVRFLPHDRVTPERIAGLALGAFGVAVLTGFHPGGGWWAVAGTLAVVASSLSYASAGVFGQLRIRTVPGPVLATGSMLACGLILAPVAAFQLPERAPSLEGAASLAALTLLGTALAQLILFRVLRLHGSSRLSLVTYLMPPFAVVYGALLLDEPVTAGALGGLALILAGVALASGAVRIPRRAPA